MTRTATCIILRVVEETHDGEQRTTFYGPFLPHYGSATKTMVAELENEALNRGSDAFVYVEDVFIGTRESDAAVVAVR